METFSALLAICAGNSPVTGEFLTHRGQWRGALMFYMICTWLNGWVNNGEAGDLRRHRAHYDVTVMLQYKTTTKHIKARMVCLFLRGVYLAWDGLYRCRSLGNTHGCHGVSNRKQLDYLVNSFQLTAGNRWPVDSPHKRPASWKKVSIS